MFQSWSEFAPAATIAGKALSRQVASGLLRRDHEQRSPRISLARAMTRCASALVMGPTPMFPMLLTQLDDGSIKGSELARSRREIDAMAPQAFMRVTVWWALAPTRRCLQEFRWTKKHETGKRVPA
jgi:hypothetical protein